MPEILLGLFTNKGGNGTLFTGGAFGELVVLAFLPAPPESFLVFFFYKAYIDII